ncbi:NDR1/HIN1-like protein 1 [Nymphaea colorata]|uniref:Late embryogenesis abundant protein LEA-2 subgroup domain-containing protein n=1 Tax=Nymphaea colorata TaxID=210225 RepID=A0A5K0Z3S2_9MAGN|nr:NDR1/HIN1-like protein 1 [Nymphaea colorata]
MSKKDCGNHCHDGKEKLYRRLFGCLLATIFVILLIILIVWLVLRPSKPSFVLQDATVLQFNVTGAPNLLSATLQVTLVSRNPNDRVGVYYERMEVYAAYMNQQVTLRTVLPPTYQGHGEISVWSPFLSGNNVPVAPFLAASLAQAQSYGTGMFSIRVDGWVRWKVGSWSSGRYHLYVDCNAYLTLTGRGKPAVFPIAHCYTDV